MIQVKVEDNVSSGIKDFRVGVALLIATYWIFNIKYPKESCKTLNYLASLFGMEDMTASVKMLLKL